MITYEFLRKSILPLEQINAVIPKKGLIIDLGCGQGTISKFLASKGNRKIIGVDANEKRLPKISGKNLKFITDDVTKYSFKNVDGIILSDVLHHIDPSKQRKLIIAIKKSMNPNGVLVIKEIDAGEFLRSKLSRLWDFILYPRDAIHYWNSKTLKKFLEDLGFKVKIIRAAKFFPGSTTLYICNK